MIERPQNLEAVLKLAGTLMADGRPFAYCAGGTDLIPQMKMHNRTVEALISLTSLDELREVRHEPDRSVLWVGSQVTLTEFAKHPMILRHCPVVAATASLVASPQIRNRATVGGNLLVDNRCIYFNQTALNRAAHGACFKSDGECCHLVPAAKRGRNPLCRARFVSDLAPVLLLLKGTLVLMSNAGIRRVPLSQFYLQDGITRTILTHGEILTAIEIELNPSRHVHYEKLRIRNAIDFPSLGVAVSRDPVAIGVALTGVHTHPIHARFEGEDDSDLEEQAILEMTRLASPMKQDFFSPQYRRQMIGVLIKKGLRHLRGHA